jgi:hypothetical protein
MEGFVGRDDVGMEEAGIIENLKNFGASFTKLFCHIFDAEN